MRYAVGGNRGRTTREQRADRARYVVGWQLQSLIMRPLELFADVRNRVQLRFLLHAEQQESEQQRKKTGVH
jgi:hypothetical protein